MDGDGTHSLDSLQRRYSGPMGIAVIGDCGVLYLEHGCLGSNGPDGKGFAGCEVVIAHLAGRYAHAAPVLYILICAVGQGIIRILLKDCVSVFHGDRRLNGAAGIIVGSLHPQDGHTVQMPGRNEDLSRCNRFCCKAVVSAAFSRESSRGYRKIL